MGAKGVTDPPDCRLGSVAQMVMKHAKTSVLLVKESPSIIAGETQLRENTGLNRVLIATDGSKHIEVVTQFLLALPLSRQCKVIIVSAVQSNIAALVRVPTLDFQTNQELLANLQAAKESESRQITTQVEKQLRTRGYRIASIVIRGEAAESILAAAREYNADIITVSSRGLTGAESRLLSSVTERIATYANCSVLVVRTAK
jgi:nucleotide-binding universal stress UspA family protein